MKYQGNINEVAALQPDFLGFIFHEESPRIFEGIIPELPQNMKKVGVFVDKDFDYILTEVRQHNLQVVQLHGEESPELCERLRAENLEVIKVFSIKDEFNFDKLIPFENACDYYLFDTKGKLPGGNGYTFNWNVLKNYPSTKPFFLSGGIGLNQLENIKEFQKNEASKYCFALDVNSMFEIKPGLKNSVNLKKLISLL